jgi:hypothetical protein
MIAKRLSAAQSSPMQIWQDYVPAQRGKSCTVFLQTQAEFFVVRDAQSLEIRKESLAHDL